MKSPCEDISISEFFDRKELSKKGKWILLATIFASSMAFIDATIVNVALAAIQNSLHASIGQLQWIVEAYALTLAALLILGGSLGDSYGRRKIFLIGVFIFTLASIACGLALTTLQLIIARAIQGIGAALLIPGSLALITASFPKEQRGRAIGTWAGFTAIMAAAGPLAGGWLVEYLSWRWIFFLNIPLAILVFAVTLLSIEESKSAQQNAKVDVVGSLLLTLGLGAIILGLIEWQSSAILVFTAEIFGLSALTLFFLIEMRKSSPMLPLKIFGSRNFTAANIITFFLYFALYGVLFFLPLNLIQIKGYTAFEAGAALVPLILLIFLLSRWMGALVERIGPRLFLIIGSTIAAVGFSLFIFANNTVSYWTGFFPAVLVLGLGMAICVAPLTTLVMGSVSENYIGAGSGINNAISRIAGLLAIAIFGVVMTMIFDHHLKAGLTKSTLPAAVQQEILSQKNQLADIKTNNEDASQLIKNSFIAGYQIILCISVLFGLVSALCASILIERVE